MSILKSLHILTVIISISGFFVRGLWVMSNSPWLQKRWVKITPHINDTILLITGITLAIQIQQYPFVHGWITAKVLALLAYIGLGMMTIRHGRSKQQRIITWILAMLVFVYMVMVARTKLIFPL